MQKASIAGSILCLLVLIITAGAGCTSQAPKDSMMATGTIEELDDTTKTSMQKLTMSDTTSSTDDSMMSSSGTYSDYSSDQLAFAKTGKVILFFKANWCPSCRSVDADIINHLKEIPTNVHILKINYDDSRDLKIKYGVTYQHTFVSVDATGKLLKKWSGSPTLQSILSEIK